MSILSKLILGSPAQAKRIAMQCGWRLNCNRCGEVARARIDLRNDLSIEYDEQAAYRLISAARVLMARETLLPAYGGRADLRRQRNWSAARLAAGQMWMNKAEVFLSV